MAANSLNFELQRLVIDFQINVTCEIQHSKSNAIRFPAYKSISKTLHQSYSRNRSFSGDPLTIKFRTHSKQSFRPTKKPRQKKPPAKNSTIIPFSHPCPLIEQRKNQNTGRGAHTRSIKKGPRRARNSGPARTVIHQPGAAAALPIAENSRAQQLYFARLGWRIWRRALHSHFPRVISAYTRAL